MIYLDILNWDLELYLPSRQAGLTLDIRHLDFFRYWLLRFILLSYLHATASDSTANYNVRI